jgi:hypothetical protein
MVESYLSICGILRRLCDPPVQLDVIGKMPDVASATTSSCKHVEKLIGGLAESDIDALPGRLATWALGLDLVAVIQGGTRV